MYLQIGLFLIWFISEPIDIGNVFSQDTQKQSLVAFLIFGFLFFALFDVKHVDILFPCRENINEKYFLKKTFKF